MSTHTHPWHAIKKLLFLDGIVYAKMHTLYPGKSVYRHNFVEASEMHHRTDLCGHARAALDVASRENSIAVVIGRAPDVVVRRGSDGHGSWRRGNARGRRGVVVPVDAHHVPASAYLTVGAGASHVACGEAYIAHHIRRRPAEALKTRNTNNFYLFCFLKQNTRLWGKTLTTEKKKADNSRQYGTCTIAYTEGTHKDRFAGFHFLEGETSSMEHHARTWGHAYGSEALRVVTPTYSSNIPGNPVYRNCLRSWETKWDRKRNKFASTLTKRFGRNYHVRHATNPTGKDSTKHRR